MDPLGAIVVDVCGVGLVGLLATELVLDNFGFSSLIVPSFPLSMRIRCSNGRPAPIGSETGSSGIGGGLLTLDDDGDSMGGVALLARSSFSCFSFNNLSQSPKTNKVIM